jgi:hypothetical protein
MAGASVSGGLKLDVTLSGPSSPVHAMFRSAVWIVSSPTLRPVTLDLTSGSFSLGPFVLLNCLIELSQEVSRLLFDPICACGYYLKTNEIRTARSFVNKATAPTEISGALGVVSEVTSILYTPAANPAS